MEEIQLKVKHISFFILTSILGMVVFVLSGCSERPTTNDSSDIIKKKDNIALNNNEISSFDLASGSNGNSPKVNLNSGYEMPIAGIGTFNLSDEECYNSVSVALEEGVRLIDTAYIYGNEQAVGRAIRDSDVPRSDIFIITKIYTSQFENAQDAIEEAIEKLDVDYIDLMLLHHPGENDVDAYLEMEKAVEEGKIHSIGLSNWYVEEIDDFLSKINVIPALIQNEIHPYYQETEVVPYMQKKGIVMQAWYPLGGRGNRRELLSDQTIVEIANDHNKSTAQVILRWHLQRGIVVIPGSSNSDHIKENISLFDFELSNQEMERIDGLNRDEKLGGWY